MVEDEPNIRELVCLHLGLEGYVCEGVGDGQAARRRAESERYDLLVLDLMLPGLDGVALTRAVRNGRLLGYPDGFLAKIMSSGANAARTTI